jgi:archaemetzincin
VRAFSPARRKFLQTSGILCASALVTRRACADAASSRRVYIQPFGTGLTPAQVDFVERALLAFYDIDVVRRQAAVLPTAAYYAPRKRYRAERLLAALDRMAPSDAYRILGLTDVDISTTKGPYADWGVMGLGSMDGKSCVLSSFRCLRSAKNVEHAVIRLGKTAVHELGHTFGLPHCPTRGCIMEDGRGTATTTDHEYDLCSACRARLVETGHAIAKAGEIPWSRP